MTRTSEEVELRIASLRTVKQIIATIDKPILTKEEVEHMMHIAFAKGVEYGCIRAAELL